MFKLFEARKSVDFVEDHKGKITFLECNANGQYGCLETDLDYPISEAIADDLAHIANGRKLR